MRQNLYNIYSRRVVRVQKSQAMNYRQNFNKHPKNKNMKSEISFYKNKQYRLSFVIYSLITYFLKFMERIEDKVQNTK